MAKSKKRKYNNPPRRKHDWGDISASFLLTERQAEKYRDMIDDARDDAMGEQIADMMHHALRASSPAQARAERRNQWGTIYSTTPITAEEARAMEAFFTHKAAMP